jgi:hypothetical protein
MEILFYAPKKNYVDDLKYESIFQFGVVYEVPYILIVFFV